MPKLPTPGTNAASQNMAVPPLDPPDRFAGGDVVAAIRLPVDVSMASCRHIIVVRYTRDERQLFSVHEIARNTSASPWYAVNGHYDVSYPRALGIMAEKAGAYAT